MKFVIMFVKVEVSMATKGALSYIVKASMVTLLVMWASSAVHATLGTPQDNEQRRAKVYRGASIASLVAERPEDVIEINSGTSPPLPMAAPPGVPQILFQADRAENVVTAVVLSTAPRIDDTGNWIVTDVRVRIIEVMKATTFNLFPGGEVTFLQQGGEITSGAKTVRGVVGWAIPFRAGKEYLLFPWRGQDSTLRVHPLNAYERDDGVYRNLMLHGPFEKSDRPAAEVLAMLRRGIRH